MTARFRDASNIQCRHPPGTNNHNFCICPQGISITSLGDYIIDINLRKTKGFRYSLRCTCLRPPFAFTFLLLETERSHKKLTVKRCVDIGLWNSHSWINFEFSMLDSPKRHFHYCKIVSLESDSIIKKIHTRCFFLSVYTSVGTFVLFFFQETWHFMVLIFCHT